MLVIKKTGKCYSTRLAAIKELGTKEYRRLVRHNGVIFINEIND